MGSVQHNKNKHEKDKKDIERLKSKRKELTFIIVMTSLPPHVHATQYS